MPRYIRIFAPAAVFALLAGTAVLLWISMDVGGAGAPRELLDPGAFVRYLVPAARTMVNLSLSLVIGALVMTVWAFSPEKPEWRLGLDIAAGGAAVLAIAAGVTFIGSFVDASGQPFSSSPEFGAALAQFATEIDLGKLWMLEILLAVVLSVLAFAIRGRKMALIPLTLAVIAIMPLAAQGHAAGASGHNLALNAMFLHIGGAAVWVGGLLVIALIAQKTERSRLPILVQRYSTLALFAFFAVFTSGVVSGWMRLYTWTELFSTGYGIMLVMKSVLLVVLFGFGALHRTRLIPRMAEKGAPGTRAFVWFVISEMLVLGAVNGVAGALGRSQTPVPIEPARDSGERVSPAEWLTGDPLPPEFTFARVFTEWRFDILWAFAAAVGVGWYLWAVLKLRRRGDKWPVGRTVSWILGMLLFFWVTNGFFNAYERYLFSLHMLAHMFLSMAIPILMVLGGPVTLVLRTTQKRRDGSWGAREWVMWSTETPWAKIVTNPIIAAVIFVGSLWIFYFTPVLRWAMEEHLGHVWMVAHFVIAGYFFTLSMVGVDPVPLRFPYALRLVTLLATMASHAFFGVTIMSSSGLLAADWFGAMGRTWGSPPLIDQQEGGAIAWGVGEIPTLALTLLVAVQWFRSDEREQRRKDRAAARLGDVELEAYNEMLRKQAERDARAGR